MNCVRGVFAKMNSFVASHFCDLHVCCLCTGSEFFMLLGRVALSVLNAMTWSISDRKDKLCLPLTG